MFLILIISFLYKDPTILSSNKIDFPGQQPLFKNQKRQRKDPETSIKLNLEDSDSCDGSWKSLDKNEDNFKIIDQK